MDLKDHSEMLVKEYELCQDHAKHLDNNIWTTSGFIGLGSIASLLLLDYKTLNHLSVMLVGLIVISIVWIWWKMANRWWDIQHSTFMRMRHIEEEIHLYQMRYIEFFDKRVEGRDKGLPNGLGEKRVEEMSKQFPNFYKGKVRGTLKWLPRFITLIWTVYILVILFS